MVTKEERETFQQKVLEQLQKQYPTSEYLIVFDYKESAVEQAVKRRLIEAVGKEQAFYLNLPQFTDVLDTPSSFQKDPTLIVEMGRKRFNRPLEFEESYEVYYGVVSLKILQQLASTIKQLTLKDYIPYLAELFTTFRVPRLFTQYEAPFLVIEGLEFDSLYKNTGTEDQIRTKTFTLPIKNYEAISFIIKVPQTELSWHISIKKATTEKFKREYAFTWYADEVYWPIIVYTVDLHIPTKAWNTVLLLSEDLLKRDRISENGLEYTIPRIAFEVNRDLFLMGQALVAKEFFSESFKWRNLTVYYPKGDAALKGFIIQALNILDQDQIHFVPDLEQKIEAIVFSLGIRGLFAGRVTREQIGTRLILYIDLSSYSGITLTVIMHELLHYTSVVIDVNPVIRESFTQLATYLLLPPEIFQKFKEETTSEERKTVSTFFRAGYHYTVLPLFLYETFLKTREKEFLDLFFTTDLPLFYERLTKLFAQKRFYEELAYLLDFKNKEKYVLREDTYEFLMNEFGRVVLHLIVIYYNKEIITQDFTYELVTLYYNGAAFRLKGTEYDIKWVDLTPYYHKLPETIQQIFKIL